MNDAMNTLLFIRSDDNDSQLAFVTTAAAEKDMNVSMPFYICWNTSHAISCVITRDEYACMPDPVVTDISRSQSLLK